MKKKYTGANLNSQLRGSQSSSRNGNSFTTRTQRGRLTMIGLKRGPDSNGLKSATPKPINTMSLRKENKGQDTTIEIVPAGGSGWVKATPVEPEPKPAPTPPPEEVKEVEKEPEQPPKPAWGKESAEKPAILATEASNEKPGWASDEDELLADSDYPALGAKLSNKRTITNHSSSHGLTAEESLEAARRELPSGPQMGNTRSNRYSEPVSRMQQRPNYFQDNYDNRYSNRGSYRRDDYRPNHYQDRYDKRRSYGSDRDRRGYDYQDQRDYGGGFGGGGRDRRQYEGWNRGYDRYDDRRGYDRQYDNRRSYDNRRQYDGGYDDRRRPFDRSGRDYYDHSNNYRSGPDSRYSNQSGGFHNRQDDYGDRRDMGREQYDHIDRRDEREEVMDGRDNGGRGERRDLPERDSHDKPSETTTKTAPAPSPAPASPAPAAPPQVPETTDTSTKATPAAATQKTETPKAATTSNASSNDDADLVQLMKTDQHAYMKELARRRKAERIKAEEEEKRQEEERNRRKAQEAEALKRQQEEKLKVEREQEEQRKQQQQREQQQREQQQREQQQREQQQRQHRQREQDAGASMHTNSRRPFHQRNPAASQLPQNWRTRSEPSALPVSPISPGRREGQSRERARSQQNMDDGLTPITITGRPDRARARDRHPSETAPPNNVVPRPSAWGNTKTKIRLPEDSPPNYHNSPPQIASPDQRPLPSRQSQPSSFELNGRQAFTRIMPRPGRPTQKKLYDPKQEKFVDVPDAKESQNETKIIRQPAIRVVKRAKPASSSSKARDNNNKNSAGETTQNQYRESKSDRPAQPTKGAARVFFRMKTVAPKPSVTAKSDGESKARVVRNVKNRQNRGKGGNNKSRKKHQQQQQSGSSGKQSGEQSSSKQSSKHSNKQSHKKSRDKTIKSPKAAVETKTVPTKSAPPEKPVPPPKPPPPENAWQARNLVNVLKGRGVVPPDVPVPQPKPAAASKPAELPVKTHAKAPVKAQAKAQPPVPQHPVHQPPLHQPPLHQPPVHQPQVYQPPVHQPPVNNPPLASVPVPGPPTASGPAPNSAPLLPPYKPIAPPGAQVPRPPQVFVPGTATPSYNPVLGSNLTGNDMYSPIQQRVDIPEPPMPVDEPEPQRMFHLEDSNSALSNISKAILQSTQPLSVSVDYSQLRFTPWSASLMTGNSLGGIGMTQPGTWSDTSLQTQPTWSNPGTGAQWSDSGHTWSREWEAPPPYTSDFPPTEVKPDPHEMDSLVATTMQTAELPLNAALQLNSAAAPHTMPRDLMHHNTASAPLQRETIPNVNLQQPQQQQQKQKRQSHQQQQRSGPKRSKNARRPGRNARKGKGSQKGQSKPPVRRANGDKSNGRSNQKNDSSKETKAESSNRGQRNKNRGPKNRGGKKSNKSSRNQSNRGQSGRSRGGGGGGGGSSKASAPVRRLNKSSAQE